MATGVQETAVEHAIPSQAPTAVAARRRAALVKLVPMLVGNVVLPYLLYLVLSHTGFTTMTALTVSAIPPVILTVFTALRTHKLDVLGAMSLITIVIALITEMLTGNARFMLAKDGLFPLVIGLGMLVSLVVGKPLIYYVIKNVFAAGRPEAIQRLERSWQHAGFRHEVAKHTALSGVVLLVMVTVQVAGAFLLPVGVALPLLNVFQLVAAGALVVFNRIALRASMTRYAG